MPYIKQEYRGKLDDAMGIVASAMQAVPDDKQVGAWNYFITQFFVSGMPKEFAYQYIVNVLGTLEAVKLEFYRRMASPYEDVKKEENGDAYPTGT